MSTLGHVEYIRGYHYECGRIPCVHQGMFSTSEKYHQNMGDIMNTLGMFSTLGDIMMHVGDIMSTLGDVQHIRWIS